MKYIARTLYPRHGNRPIIALSGGPFQDVELTPHQAIHLALGLGGLADAASEENVTDPAWKPSTLDMTDCLGDCCPDFYEAKRQGEMQAAEFAARDPDRFLTKGECEIAIRMFRSGMPFDSIGGRLNLSRAALQEWAASDPEVVRAVLAKAGI